MKQYNRIADEILTLDTFPERFRIMDSEPEKRMELRRIIISAAGKIFTRRGFFCGQVSAIIRAV